MIAQEKNPAFFIRGRLFFLISFFAFLFACGTPKIKPIDEKTTLKKDSLFGKKVAKTIEKNFKFVREPQITAYLLEIGEKIVSKWTYLEPTLVINVYSELSLVPIRNQVRNYSLPGNHLYLSAELLMRVSNEAELAALLAVELEHLKKRHLIRKILGTEKNETPHHVDYPRSSGWKEVMESLPHLKQEEEAVQDAVEALYDLGYDTRAVVTLYQIYQSFKGRSPFEIEEIDHIIKVARRKIVSKVPLLNPTVQTEGFRKFKKKMVAL